MKSLIRRAKKLIFSCALALFGRDVTIEGRPEKLRLLPLVWKGRLHLLGLDGYAHFTSIEFVTPHMVRLVDATLCQAGPSHPVEPSATKCKIAHVMLCHLPAPQTQGLLEHHRQMSDDYDQILAYGGPREEFDKIGWDRKIFLKDSIMRGPTEKFTYDELLPALVAHYSGGQPPDWVFIGDYDAIPLRYDYLHASVLKAKEHKKSFAAKQVRDITASNCGYITGPTLEYQMGWLAKNPANRNIRIYHCLGAALLFTWDCLLGKVANQHRFPELLFEVGLPTYAVLGGHSIMAMETCSEEWRAIRYRPVYPVSDLERLQAEGVPIVHPVKDIKAFLQLAPALQKRASASRALAK
jgi:hypothetical protein